MTRSIETDYERIGYSYYCIYCGTHIKRQEHYHDGGCDGVSYECTCENSHEAARIKNETEKLKTQLDQLKESAQSKLNKHRYDEVVTDAAYKFKQPIPKE